MKTAQQFTATQSDAVDRAKELVESLNFQNYIQLDNFTREDIKILLELKLIKLADTFGIFCGRIEDSELVYICPILMDISKNYID